MPDLRWTSLGGTLLDGNGDLAMASPRESLIDMVRTRLKADLDGWQLYRIGADLATNIGFAIEDEMEITIRRQIYNSLQKQLLPPGSFTVKTVPFGSQIDVYVYVNNELISTVLVNKQSGTARVV
jgi:hypothetical protein